MSEAIDHGRRGFLGTAAMTIAAAELGMIGLADAQFRKTSLAAATTIKPGPSHRSGGSPFRGCSFELADNFDGGNPRAPG